MPESHVQRYIDAVHAVEQRNDLDAIVGVYTEDAEILNVNQAPIKGTDEIRAFWKDLRGLFSEMSSEFSHIVVQGDEAALEFATRGVRADTGQPILFMGVTMATFRDGKIASDRGYVLEVPS